MIVIRRVATDLRVRMWFENAMFCMSVIAFLSVPAVVLLG